ncbi:MAG TPA: phosphoribosylanthranilate isomerase [Acidimicrobiia bacterium]|jgi:phosphoribosylanthranilate isomerase|nr:phosphoribosylanthranilate isomerase [Acidimicrobiia bacterium]
MSVRWEADGLFVKVCGLGTPEDVEAAADAGADAVGFVFWEPSPRHHDLQTIRRLAGASPVTTVLVTVDLDSQELLAAATQAGVDAVQPHGRHSGVAAAAARRFGLGVIQPVRAGQEPPPETPNELLLIDTPHATLPGGTGETFDWDAIAHLERRFLLAGGLDPDNVADAVQRVRPFGVDASSGLESSPGVKDPARIRDFVKVAKETHRP